MIKKENDKECNDKNKSNGNTNDDTKDPEKGDNDKSNDNNNDTENTTSKTKKKKSLPAPIFLSGGMRTGNLYGGTAKDNNGFSSNKNYSNNNRNKKYPRSKHGNYGNSSRENNENNHSKNSGGGLSSSPPKTRKGNVTRVFPKFCIVNSDIYVSKAVVERNEHGHHN